MSIGIIFKHMVCRMRDHTDESLTYTFLYHYNFFLEGALSLKVYYTKIHWKLYGERIMQRIS